jgi:DNA-binding XRE family transcriptional regulator
MSSFGIDGKKVRHLRENKGWTQEALAAKIGGDCTGKSISRIERSCRCTLQTAEDLAQVFGLTIDDLRAPSAREPAAPEPPASAAQPAGAHPTSPGRRLFFNHLLECHTQLFAGRDEELGKIGVLLATTPSGYVFVEGSSGFGKTSLLAKLVQVHPDCVYHFISQAYKGNQADFDPTQLEWLLANLHEQIQPEMPLPADRLSLALRFRQLLMSPVQGRPLTLVLDAVDEVDRHPNYLRGWLPKRLPHGWHIVFSARTLGEISYLPEIGLELSDIQLHLRLCGLSEMAIRDLLVQAGKLAAPLAKDRSFVAALHKVSEGDPFYLRFLVEDIREGKLTPDNLDQTPSGLAGYLDGQLDQLNRSAHRSQHRDILGYILTANGPLSRKDLINLVPGLDGLNFGEIIKDIHRFLLVHGDRYTFCHDRFRAYFVSKIR